MAYPAAVAAALTLLAGFAGGVLLAGRQLAYDSWPEPPPPDQPKAVQPPPPVAGDDAPAREKPRRKRKTGQGEGYDKPKKRPKGAGPPSAQTRISVGIFKSG